MFTRAQPDTRRFECLRFAPVRAKPRSTGPRAPSRARKDSRKLESFFYCIFEHSRTFRHSGNHRFRGGTGGNQNQVETRNEHYDNLNYTKKGKLRRVNPKYRLRWNKNNVPVWHTYTRFALLSPKVTKAEWSEGTQSWLRCGAFARIRALRFQNRLDGGR